MIMRDTIEHSQSEISLPPNSQTQKNGAKLYMFDAIPCHQDSPLYEKIHDEAISKMNELYDET